VISPFGLVDSSIAFVHFLDFVQQCFGREKIVRAVARPDIYITDHAILIDDHIGAFGLPSVLIKHAKIRHGFSAGVAKQWIVDLGEVSEGFLGKWRINAHAQYLSVFSLELRVVVRTGRLQVLDSRRAKIEHVKIDQNIFAFKAAQLEFTALGAVQFEVGGFVADFKRPRVARQRQE